MPAYRLRRLRGPERPASTLPALLPLPPCCGPPEAILRGAERLRPAAAALMAALLPCRGPWRALLPGDRLLLPGDRLLLPGGPGRPPAAPCGPAAGPCCGRPGRPLCGRPCPPDPVALTPANWRSGVRTIAHFK